MKVKSRLFCFLLMLCTFSHTINAQQAAPNRDYAKETALRRAHPAMQQGETEWVSNSDETRIVSYVRRSGKEEFLITINFSNRPFTGLIGADSNARYIEKTLSLAPANSINKPRPVSLPAINLEAWGFRIFQRVN